MLKNATLEKLSELFAVPLLATKLESIGFHYEERLKHFWRIQGRLTQVIKLESLDTLSGKGLKPDRLCFSLAVRTEAPRFREWCEAYVGRPFRIDQGTQPNKPSFSVAIDYLSLSELERQERSASDTFKQKAINQFAGVEPPSLRTHPALEHDTEVLSALIAKLEQWIDPQFIYDQRSSPLDLRYGLFALYTEQQENATRFFFYWMRERKALLSKKAEDFSNKELDELRLTEAVFGLFSQELQQSLENSFTQKLAQVELHRKLQASKSLAQTLGNKGLELRLSPAQTYKECLRLNLTEFGKPIQVEVNEHGKLLLVGAKPIVDTPAVLLLSPEGELLCRWNLKTAGYYPKPSTRYPLLLENKQDFMLLNLLFKADPSESHPPLTRVDGIHSIRWLPKREQYAGISWNADTETQKLVFLNKQLELTEEISLSTGYFTATQIYAELELIASVDQKASQTLIADLAGTTLHTLKFGKDNTEHKLSPTGRYLANYGHKSYIDLFDLQEGTHHKLPLHQKKIKGYFKSLYKGEDKHLTANEVAFSPNGEYLVATGTYGKYAAWCLEDLQRTELIPPKEILQKMAFSNGDSIIYEGQEYNRPIEVEYQKQRLLVNRRENTARQIAFSAAGDCFYLELDKLLLAWNNQFQCIGCFPKSGKYQFHHFGYLSIIVDSELIVLKSD